MTIRTHLPTLLLLLLALGCGSASTGGGTNDPPTPPSPPSPPSPPTFHDGFETGLGLWTKDAEVPPSPGNPGVPVDWSIEPSSEVVHAGALSARYDLDGRQDDGTIWLERAFALEPARPYAVHVEAAYWSDSESFNTTAMVALYAGGESPEEELDFDVSQPLNEVAGWKTYGASFDVTSGADGSVHVGVGLTVVWETWITYYLDDVRVWIEPR